MIYLNRIEPVLPVTALQTYEIVAPLATHHKRISCEEAGCEAWRYGWKTVIANPSSDLGAQRVRYITEHSGRRYTVKKYGDNGVVGAIEFIFPAGQTCFQPHYVLDREPFYRRWGGDYRGRTGDGMTHTRPEHWVEDFAENQGRVARSIERG